VIIYLPVKYGKDNKSYKNREWSGRCVSYYCHQSSPEILCHIGHWWLFSQKWFVIFKKYI
jgi:hypothetical protein